MEAMIEFKDWKKINGYAKAAHELFNGAEIGGMAVMEEVKRGEWWLKDPAILKQTVTGGTCSLDKEDLANYYTTAAIKRKKSKNRYRFLWWHSHHTMGAFWSTTDDIAIKEFNGGDFSFALVVSWAKDPDEHILRISYWDPEESHIDTEFTIVNQPGNNISKAILKEVEDKCDRGLIVANKSEIMNKYRNYQQTRLFGLKPESNLKATINKKVNTTIEIPDETVVCETISEVTSHLESAIETLNEALLNKEISWALYNVEFEKLEEFASVYDFQLERPFSCSIAISRIKSWKTCEWFSLDEDLASYNASFNIGEYVS